MRLKNDIKIDAMESRMRQLLWRRKHMAPDFTGHQCLVMEKKSAEPNILFGDITTQRLTISYIPTVVGNMVVQVKIGESGSRSWQDQNGMWAGMMGWNDGLE